MRQDTIEGLRVHLMGGTDREGGGSGPLVVLLHGFGAPGTDLVGLWRQLDVPRAVRFAFPEAPLSLRDELGTPAYGEGRAWWRIDIEALQAAATGAPHADRSEELPPGLASTKAQLERFLDGLTASLAAPADQVLIGGFSQGAMLATEIAFTTARPLAGLAILSGTPINGEAWRRGLAERTSLPVLQSNGRSDPLLPFGAAETWRDAMRDAGLDVRWIEFNGGHGISDSVVDAFAQFTRDVFPASD
jgi:phospholipase/carboxylesterase